MNEVELLMPGELCLHLPTNILDLLESLEKNIPTLINVSDEQGRRMLIECVRTEDLVTIKVINGDDLMSSVMIKDERNDEDNDSAFVLSMVSDYSRPAEDHGLLPSAEELLVEETVFADDCKTTACSTGEMQVDVREDSVSELPPSVDCFVQLPSSDLKSVENGMSLRNAEHLPSTRVDCAVQYPKVISDILVFRCSHCDSEYLNEETGQKHLGCLHPHSAGTLVAEVVKTAYVCCTCSQSFRDCSRWQLHMKTVHSVFAGGRLKPYSKCENFIRRHLVSWQNHRYEPIECLVCQSQMHLSESYYLHIRRHHRSDPQYRAAMKHLIQVREMRLRKKCRMSIRCFKCDDMLTEYTIISHLRAVHSTDPCLNQMIATTKLCIKNMMRSQSLANQKVKISCQFCEKEMKNSTLKSHLEFHCPALIAVVPNAEIRQEVLESAAKSGAVLVRMPRTTTCNECNKTMTLKAFYHHRRRVHGIGIDGAKTYSCSYCKKTFWDQFHLQNHLLIHTRDRAFVCLVCCRSFINMVSYSEHHRKVHERQFLHGCSVCGRGFWKRVEKTRHNCKPQDLSINQLKNARLAAKARAVLDRWEGPFYLEMDRNEALKFTNNAANFSHHLKQNTLQDKKKLVCTVCKKSFQSIRYFQSHLRYSHLQDYDLICENCGLGFWNVRQMTSHKCDSSKRSYNTKKRILLATKAKEKLKDIPKPYYCVIGASDPSVNYPSLIRTDLECSKAPCQTADEDGKEEAINCRANILGFRKDNKLTDAENLEHKNVERSSVKEKKTSWLTQVQADCTLCSICGKEIKLKNYYPHMRRVHCDDSHKPIAWKICEQCGYRCQDNYKFRRHCLTHNKKAAVIPCELCGRLSHELVDYNHHFKHCHLGQFNIRCELCGKGFWKISALQSHICYPELREENLRLQQLKAESAVKKRDAIRKATGINSNIGVCGRKKNSHQKILVKKNCSEPEKKKCRNNKQKSSAYRNAKHEVLKKENDRIPGQRSLCTDLQRQTGCHDNDTSLVTTVIGHSVIPERSLNDVGETTDEIQRRSHFKGNCTVENFNKPADFESKIVGLSTLINLGTNTKVGKQTIGLKGSAEEKISRNQKPCKQDLVVSVHSRTENVHQYETRKRQVSFHALIGKK